MRGCARGEPLEPVERAVRPGGERRSDSPLERAVAGEDPRGLGGLPARVERRGPPQRDGLRVASHAQVERERREALARRRRGGALAARGLQHADPDRGARGHHGRRDDDHRYTRSRAHRRDRSGNAEPAAVVTNHTRRPDPLRRRYISNSNGYLPRITQPGEGRDPRDRRHGRARAPRERRRAALRRRARARGVERGSHPGRRARAARQPRVADRGRGRRPRPLRSSSTAPSAPAPRSRPRRSRSSATARSSRSRAGTPTGSGTASRRSCR